MNAQVVEDKCLCLCNKTTELSELDDKFHFYLWLVTKTKSMCMKPEVKCLEHERFLKGCKNEDLKYEIP